mmetsp:Transcript_114244/g.369118  ORF Transcript_114244/g.369118 Transcript_114244/m.369118 type:complete len:378 (+) Transcript_114244:130-1263(+)
MGPRQLLLELQHPGVAGEGAVGAALDGGDELHLEQLHHLIVELVAVGVLDEVSVAQACDLPAHGLDVLLPEDTQDDVRDARDVALELDENHGEGAVRLVAEAHLGRVRHRDSIRLRAGPPAGPAGLAGGGGGPGALGEDPGNADLGRHQVVEGPHLLLVVLVDEAIPHRGVHAREHPAVADQLEQIGPRHDLLHVAPDGHEGHLDASMAEVVHDVLDSVYRRGVQGVHGRHVQDHILRGCVVADVINEGQDRILDVGGISKVHGRADARDENIGNEGAPALQLNGPVHRRAWHPPEDGDGRANGFKDDDDEGHDHRQRDALEDTQKQGADEGYDPEHKIVPLDFEKLNGDVVGDERDDRVHHDGCKRKHGEVVEARR